MGRERQVTRGITITSTETVNTIVEGQAVKNDGLRCDATVIGYVGFNALGDSPPGSPMTVQAGRVPALVSGSPSAGTQLTLDSAGECLAAAGGELVVALLEEGPTDLDNGLSMVWAFETPYTMPTP